MHILFIDNFDSFTWNLVDEFARRGASVDVWRNTTPADELLARGMANQSLVVLSPGPGAPADAGVCIELIRRAAGQLPILGICLGHQAIVEAYGGRVGPAGEVVHGKASRVTREAHALFEGLEESFRVGRYHSLVALEQPPELRTIAHCGDIVMGSAHTAHPVVGLQFHPESILTPAGGTILENAMGWAARFWAPPQAVDPQARIA